MKRFAAAALALFISLFSVSVDAQQVADRPVRIACVGDSITFGAGVPERERWCYPAMLQAMLGEGYAVGNFGVSARTLLSEGDHPYIKEKAYRDALAFEPDVVVIMLGTNDTKAHNWRKVAAFNRDYAKLVESFRALKSEPRVVAMVPVPAWTQGKEIDGGRVADELAPRVRRLAIRLKCETIDLHEAMKDKKTWFPDGVHPNSFGTEFIAQRVYEQVVTGGNEPKQQGPINFAAVPAPGSEHRGRMAGWGGGTWWNQHDNINQVGKDNPDLELIFLGDSITQSWTGPRDRVGGGRLGKHFGQYKAASFGISGDRTEHLLYRITNGNFDHVDPKLIVLMIGVNNIHARGHSGEQVAEGTHAVVAALRKQEPQAHILVLGSFPTGATQDHPKRLAADALHSGIASIGDEDDKVTYRDLRPLFLNPDGTPNGNMSRDHIHITGKGYAAWANAIAPDIQAILHAD